MVSEYQLDVLQTANGTTSDGPEILIDDDLVGLYQSDDITPGT